MTLQKPMQTEITMELLHDLAGAVKNVLIDVLPQQQFKVQVVNQPKMGIIITVENNDNAIYPRFVTVEKGGVLLRPSKEYRKVLGLPVEED